MLTNVPLLIVPFIAYNLVALGGVWRSAARHEGPQAQADLQKQLESLLAPDFVAAIPTAQWPRIGIYLKAMGVRLDRLPNKPQRDQDLSAQLQPWIERLPGPWHAARWVIEEWRIALFAQELRALGSPNAERVRVALAA